MNPQEYERRRTVILNILKETSEENRKRLANALISLWNVTQDICDQEWNGDLVLADYIHYDLVPATVTGILNQIDSL